MWTYDELRIGVDDAGEYHGSLAVTQTAETADAWMAPVAFTEPLVEAERLRLRIREPGGESLDSSA